MQKKSALDRDQILLSESQEDYQFKRDLYEVICQLNELFAQPTKKFSQSMLGMASGITKFVEILTYALSSQNW